MMKKLLFFILTISLFSNSIFAQDANQAYKSAKKAYNQAATAESDTRTEKLEKACKQIDIATAGISQFDEKTLPKVWLQSGKIYLDLAKVDIALSSIPGSTYTAKYPEATTKAYEAYKAALKVPSLKKYAKSEALDGLNTLWTFISNDGNQQYNNRDFKKSYELLSIVSDIDNILIENNRKSIFTDSENKNQHLFGVALSAYGAEMFAEAKNTFLALDKAGYENAMVYNTLSKIYLQEKNSAEALAVLEKGREKFPEDEWLRLSEIDYYLGEGKLDVLTGKLEAAIEADPKNVTLYATLGHVYDNLNQREMEAGNVEAAQKHFASALKYYTQALEIDGMHFNTIYNTGALYYNKAAQVNKELIELEKEGDYSAAGLRKTEAKKSEMMQLFDKSLPYFKKAEAVEPNDIGTLSALQEIYARKDDLKMTKEFKTRLETVQAGGTNAKSYFDN